MSNATPGMFDVVDGQDPMALTADDELWLAEARRMVRVVYLTTDRKKHVRAQGIGHPKSATLLGKSKNGTRLV